MAEEAAISSAVELLGNLLIQLRGVEEKIRLLKDELKRLHSFLQDSNRKQAEDKRVHNWISEIREVAQDTIEMFLLNVENARNKSLLKRCPSFAKRMYHLERIGDAIESISTRIDSIDKSRERYRIKDLCEAAESASRLQVESRRRRLCPWQKDEHLVGVDDGVKMLLAISILYEEKQGLSIAVFEGMGCGWVVVSSEFSPQDTIFQLSEHDKQKLLHEIKKLEELNGMLYRQLEGKSYFIVLDDVWKKEHLESLIAAFPNPQEKASRLLITSRNKIITKYNHKMKLLDPGKGWELLLKKAFIGSTNGKCPEEVESIGRQILEKCHGLPLAISVVGGLLMETQTKSGWEHVLSQISSHLGIAESNVSPILELSYQNLSPQLKSCFLCLAFFKEDFNIPAKRLVNIWDAQGLIQHEGSRTTDEIARDYLNELINRNMLQIQDLTVDDQLKNCRLHDLLREVCFRKAKEEIGLEIVKGEEGISSESSYEPRHRVVYGKNLQTRWSKQNKHIRSLFLLNVDREPDLCITTPSYYWKSYQLLKTLDPDGFNFRRLPNSFRFLIGLKCLRIHKAENTLLVSLELPSWLDHLKNLEVLDMRWGIAKFPRQVSLKMDRLRYFCGYTIDYGLPKVNIWRNIECLKHIKYKDWTECSSTLTSGCRLRKLGIRFDGEIERQELIKVRASLEKMQNLVILHLWGTYHQPDIAY